MTDKQQDAKPEAQAAGMTRQTARAWLLELMGDHDFIVPTEAFDELVAALSTPASHDAQQPEASGAPAGEGDAVKAAYVKHFGSDDGWLSERGSYFIEGYAVALAQQPAVVGDGSTAWISDNDLLKLRESVDDARNIRMSTKRTHLRVHRVYIPALTPAETPGDSGNDDNDVEPCESALPDCGPAIAWDCEGIGACQRCAKELGWLPAAQKEGNGNG